MNNFWILVNFELKKILGKKSVIIAIGIGLAIVIFSSFAMVINSNTMGDYSGDRLSPYDSMLLDKSYAKELEGRALDGELILEASDAYKKIDLNSSATKYTDTEEYQTYARRYSSVYTLVDSAYAKNGNAFDVEDFQNITPEMANDYYIYRENQYYTNLINNPLFSESDIEKIMSLDEEVQKPFTMYYTDGYKRFFALSITTMMITLLVLGFCMSPIFSNEYSSGADSLILSSKNGKNTLIYAKIFSSLVMSFSLMLIFNLIVFFCTLSVYGFDGANAQIQLIIPVITYNFSMLQVVILVIITSILGAFLHTSLCLFISSLSNSTIVPMTITTILIFLGMFTGTSNVLFAKLRFFLPISMGNFWDVTTQLVFNVFGLQIMLYQAISIVAVFVSTLLIVGAFFNFKSKRKSFDVFKTLKSNDIIKPKKKTADKKYH